MKHKEIKVEDTKESLLTGIRQMNDALLKGSGVGIHLDHRNLRSAKTPLEERETIRDGSTSQSVITKRAFL